MGTFHHDRHELHGITVVVDTTGPEILVGRVDDLLPERIILWDVDVHRDGEGGQSKEDFVRKAARFGVFPRHRRLVLPRDQVVSVRRLGEL
jgi:hypothetical protein